MIFNSIEFAFFLPIVFILYWFVFKKIKQQNTFILVASYFFYGWWDWRFLFLIIFSSIIDYFIAIYISQTEDNRKRKLLLLVSLFVNIGFLGFFKYSNFFLESLSDSFTFFGNPIDYSRLNIILPVGISFYTFQTLSYSIDVYRRKMKPTKDIVAFFAFVSFFPQLVAGPIERASNLLPQFHKDRSFSYQKSVDGMRQLLWGFFKKIVIADACAIYANLIFNNSSDYSGSTLFLGAFFFTFQIYCDFSGYSDIAIGTSKLFGFNLMQNFAFPYFSRDIAEFWRRWHISLNTWFRDYVYIPLGGSVGGIKMKIRNTFVIFLLSGLWHGANWTFVFWGFLNALYFLPLLLSSKNRRNIEIVAFGKHLPSIREFVSILSTFLMTLVAWIFFRSDNISSAFSYIYRMFSKTLLDIPEVCPFKILLYISMLVVIEWLGRAYLHPLVRIKEIKYGLIRWIFYFILIMLIFINIGNGQEFIYFQF